MGMDLMARYSVPPDQRRELALGADLIDRSGPDDRVEVLVVHADGSRDAVVLPKSAAEMIGTLLREASSSGEVAVLAEVSEISPEDAASILGISRPLVRRRMDAGILPFRRVGAHRRLRLIDVLDLKRREMPVRAALDELRADTDDLLAHGL
jgi:excisionase family DNA binding protein